MCQSTRFPTERLRRGGDKDKTEEAIRFGSYNIQNGCNDGLKLALRGMDQASMYLGILQDTNITGGVYTQESAGFFVVDLDAPSRHYGGVALFYKELLRFVVEKNLRNGPNVFIFHLETGGRRWYMIGFYLAPHEASTMDRIFAAIR